MTKVLPMINSQELINFTKNLNVLFVEDHEELRETTTEILSSFFNVVKSVENGQEAIDEYAKRFKEDDAYDIVLSDIQMPKIDGVELTKEIYDINPDQTVIIMSAYDESRYLLPLVNLGIEQFIKKPIDYQELLKVLLNASKKISGSKDDASDDEETKIRLSETFVFDKENSALLENDKNAYLTKYEIMFLQQLTQKVGKIYSNEDIVENYTSKNESINAQNIRKLVSKLRKKLPENSLQSIYGIGYRVTPYLEV